MTSAMPSSSSATPLAVVFGLLVYNGLAAAEPGIVALLHQVGAAHPVAGRNPVSFCNVLFISQLVSLAAFAGLFHGDLTRENFRRLSHRRWLGLLAYVALGSVIVQMLYFFALKHAAVAGIVLVSSLQIPLAALIGALLLREALARRQLGGHALILLGILAPFLLTAEGGLSAGEAHGLALALLAMLCGVANGLLAKYLADLPLGVIGVVASAASAAFFFVFASLWFGFEHFQDLLVPYIWPLVLVYAVLLVVSRHIVRQVSFRRASSQAINTVSASYPALAVLAAFAIAGQTPHAGQLLGIACIVAGMLLAMAGKKPAASLLEKQTLGDRSAVRVNA